jgi:CRISPR/Cas system-associated exonuclease Cas4 (RecB family)
MAQTQTQTSKTQIYKTIEFLIENLKQGKSIQDAIRERTPFKEEWEVNVYRIASTIDTLRIKMGIEKAIEILTNIVQPKAIELENAFKDFPIEIKTYTKDHEDIELCVSLTQYIDKTKFNAYRENVRKHQMRYDGYGGNCLQVFKL